jgi:release factor glutamine methyltransferase
VIKKPTNISIRNAVLTGAQYLQEASIVDPRREAGSLVAHLLGRDRSFVIAHADDTLTHDEWEALQSLVERRATGEPLQYITGHQEFFKLDFEVTPDVLIPRPETELIVETALELLRDDPQPYFADIGTGSGCIAISVLHELPQARAVATDVSQPALRIARRNAERHGVMDRMELRQSNCFSAVDAGQTFSLITSNPPYVTDNELESIQREVRYEPVLALAAGPDGLATIRRLLQEARPYLRSGGYLVFEIGWGQGTAVEELIDQTIWKTLKVSKDLQGIPRTFVLKGK